jgi:hypothetical protein
LNASVTRLSKWQPVQKNQDEVPKGVPKMHKEGEPYLIPFGYASRILNYITVHVDSSIRTKMYEN